MKVTQLNPIDARRLYFRRRDIEIHGIKSALSVLGGGYGMWKQTNARRVLRRMELIEKLVHLILAHKDEIYITKKMMQDLLEDAAWLEKVRAEAEAILKR